MMPGDFGLVPDVGAQPRVRCKECADEGREMDMVADREWLPGRVVDVWRCPACGSTVLMDGYEEWV